MIIAFHLISGLMFGVEWVYDDGYVIFDLGVIRIVWDYSGRYFEVK